MQLVGMRLSWSGGVWREEKEVATRGGTVKSGDGADAVAYDDGHTRRHGVAGTGLGMAVLAAPVAWDRGG